jgi:hypothetical protein
MQFIPHRPQSTLKLGIWACNLACISACHTAQSDRTHSSPPTAAPSLPLARGSYERPDTSSAPSEAAHAASGMLVYKDPTTGDFVLPPPESLAATQKNTARAAGTALTEKPSPGGGTMVELNGRFRNYVRLRVSDAGELTGDCTQLDGVQR